MFCMVCVDASCYKAHCPSVFVCGCVHGYLVLQGQDGGFVDVESDCHLGSAGTHVAVGAGRVKGTGHQQFLTWVGLLVQEDLDKQTNK